MKENKSKQEITMKSGSEDKDIVKENILSDIPEELSDILNTVPPEHRKQVSQMMISAVQMGGITSPNSAITKKITEEHITEYLAGTREQMQKGYQEKRDRKFFAFFSGLAGCAFIIAVIILLKDNPDMLEKILYTSGGIVAGAFGGYGYGKSRED